MFRSFFMAGFECATGFNSQCQWIDQVACTRHDAQVDEDYALLRSVGLLTAREAVRWPLVDREGRFDFSTVDPMLAAARRHRIELIHDLFHYGYPCELNPFSERFIERFEEYCFATARHIARNTDGPYYFTPVNEPSYLAFAGGHAALFAPHEVDRAYDLKVWLIRAAIRGIDAIWSACPGARIVNADPVCHVVAPRGEPELQDEVDYFNEVAVYESWDMLAGRSRPELGGSRRHLDIVGINYYWTNQWEHTRAGIPLMEDDDRLVPLGDLVKTVWRRYGGDICITETAHVAEKRAPWMRYVVNEAERVLDEGVPLRGVCLYPILGMPEWHEPERWTRMGLWDLHPAGERMERVLSRSFQEALQEAQARIEPLRLEPGPRVYVS